MTSSIFRDENPTASAIFPGGLPMTEEAFLSLDHTPERIELFDGSLFVTPAPSLRHQYISAELLVAFRPAARAAKLFALETINVRLRQGRIPIPDLAVFDSPSFDGVILDAEAVKLVCEIVSPSNAAADRVLKMHYYAAAGIPYYLLVEQETGTLHLFELEGNHYREHSTAVAGQTLHLTDPIDVTLVPEDLLPPF